MMNPGLGNLLFCAGLSMTRSAVQQSIRKRSFVYYHGRLNTPRAVRRLAEMVRHQHLAPAPEGACSAWHGRYHDFLEGRPFHLAKGTASHRSCLQACHRQHPISNKFAHFRQISAFSVSSVCSCSILLTEKTARFPVPSACIGPVICGQRLRFLSEETSACFARYGYFGYFAVLSVFYSEYAAPPGLQFSACQASTKFSRRRRWAVQ